jgi:flavin reductase (DIM6/NTAB) family NADH-FMN oxidoreductase RutF
MPHADFDALMLRRVLGTFATGVTVVAAMDGGEPVGMSANSFTSVSLDPPLVLFCPAHSSSTWPRLQAAGGFSISILAAHQEGVGRGFSQRGADRFAGLQWAPGPNGHPVISGAAAWLDCSLEAVHPAGDHDIAVARVLQISPEPETEPDPLVFFRGSYFSGLGAR